MDMVSFHESNCRLLVTTSFISGESSWAVAKTRLEVVLTRGNTFP